MAAQWMGWENVFQVEIDPFCQKVLEKNFPNTKRHGDIKEFDGTKYRGAIDIVSGGFPCQPFSIAGRRKGKNDDRHLWPEMLRVLREIRPSWIVGENVTGIIGVVLDEVLTDLETEGYNPESYIIPACAINAPHQRNRVWIIAHASRPRNGDSKGGCFHDFNRNISSKVRVQQEQQNRTATDAISGSPPNADSDNGRLVLISGGATIRDQKERNEGERKQIPGFESFPTQSPFRDGNDGLPAGLVRRAIHGGGNAIVPQVAFEIFKAIQATIEP